MSLDMFRKKKFLINRSILLFVISCLISNVFAQSTVIKEEAMVQKFYSLHQKPLFWFSSDKNISKATEWLTMIESADHLGIITDKFQSEQVRVALLSNKTLDNIYKEQRDRQITGWVLNFIKELQEGNIRFDYDEVTIPRDSVYINQLLRIKPEESVSQIVARIDCQDHVYNLLKKYLNDSILINQVDSIKLKKVILAMNYTRYFAIQHPAEYIIANIAATEAYYYRNDLLRLKMRTVVGMRLNHTPTIASYITNIVTFPHWNVPRSIAIKEILPKVQKNENYLEQNNYDVVNGKGKVVDDSNLKWKNYTENNFPYFFRQATGPRNSLGVLKFNLQNPFSIFLHSTSWQGAFAKDYRFLSHGCIRLEKPFELAKELLPDKIDIKALKSGKKNTESKTIKLPHKIPVFIIYMPVKVAGNKVILLPDVYGLIK